MSYLLGIDQGTTQTTAVVVDALGNVVAKHSVPLPCRFPQPGWVEQDPHQIVQTVTQACAPLLERFTCAAAGFDNQGETFLLWDRGTGQPVTAAIVWQDKRAADLCARLAGSVDVAELRRKTGLLLDSYFSAPKLLWLLQSDSELRRRAWSGDLLFGTTESWVIWTLSGRRLHVTDPSTASRTLLFDIHRGQWDDQLLATFDVPRFLLPEVRPSAGFVGELDLGAGRPVPLHAMLVDQQAALFGQGCFKPGQMKCTFGTGSFLLMNTGEQPRPSSHGLLTTVGWHMAGRTTYALDGGIFVTGSAVQWLRDNLGLIPDAAASSAAARRSGDASVVVVPALQGLAAPHWRSDVRGAVFGLSRASTADDLVRATLDGIACRTWEVVTAMARDAQQPVPHLKVDGGPSGNEYLMQAIADLLELEVRVCDAVEATAIGVAELAAVDVLGTSLDELASRRQASCVYRPAMAAPQRRHKLEQWQRAVHAAGVFHRPGVDLSKGSGNGI